MADFNLQFPIRELLDRAIAGDYSREQLAELHRLSYVLGRRFVRMRCVSGRLPLHMLGMDEADVVHDCIADLFTRTPSGELVEFSRYFEYRKATPSTLPEDLLIVHLRSLVFTVVADNIFRLLNEADPALGRIIRNIKLAVRDSKRWSLETRFDDKVLILGPSGHPGGNGRDGSLASQPMENEQVEQVVHGVIGRHPDVPSLLECLADEFERVHPRPGPVPLICFAVAVKVGYEKTHVGGPVTEGSLPPEVTGDVARILEDCLEKVDRSMRGRYVGKGKVCDEVFNRYIAALGAYFRCQCGPALGYDGPDAPTYYAALQAELPAMTKKEYAESHRPILEYLGKLVKQDLRERLVNP